MEPLPFAGFNTKPSAWGYNWTNSAPHEPTIKRSTPIARTNGYQQTPQKVSSTPEPPRNNQYVNMPAALLNSLKKDKKPFTYTPGGVNLPEVLNARLQKRMERKKKNSVGPMSPPIPESSTGLDLPTFEPPRQVIVMPTYNTPLDMYSMENAIEALEIQAGLTVTGKSLSAASRSATLPRNQTFQFQDKDYDSNRNVTQSKAFKVLQIITDTEEETPVNNQVPNKHYDEMRFTGIREKPIPSKFFHQLQRITGTEEDDDPQQHPNEVAKMGPPKTNFYEKQQGQEEHPQMKSFAVPSYDHRNQMTSGHNVTPNQVQQQNGPIFKRPAAFLPAKPFGVDSNPLNRVKPVKPAFLCNGPTRVVSSSAGTDF